MLDKTANNAMAPREMTIAQWLFNPFVRIAGGQALAVGLAVIFASALAASAGGVHFDGLLDFHLGSSVPLQVAVMEGLVNWSVITVLLWLVSLLAAPRTVRLVDIAGTQALARWPLLLAAIACIPPAVRQGNEKLVAETLAGRFAMPPAATVVGGLFALACVIWMVSLMWKAFSVSCNQRGGRAAAIFVAALLAGEAATKWLLSLMITVGSS